MYGGIFSEMLSLFQFQPCATKGNIAQNGIREKENILRNIANVPAQFVEIVLTDVLAINQFMGIEIFFLGLPGWFIAVFLYIGLSFIVQRNRPAVA